MIEPIRLGGKNPSKEEIQKIEKAIDEAWEQRNSAPDIKVDIDLNTLVGDKLSKEEIKALCGF